MLIRSKHGLEIQERILQCGQVHALQDSFFGGEKVCRKGSQPQAIMMRKGEKQYGIYASACSYGI